jgi:hypothetical protein
VQIANSLVHSLRNIAQGGHRGWDDCRTPAVLGWRLTALGLNPKRIGHAYPDVFRNLKITCHSCPVKQRCLEDMMECVNPPGWESYCPNSGTIRTLI